MPASLQHWPFLFQQLGLLCFVQASQNTDSIATDPHSLETTSIFHHDMCWGRDSHSRASLVAQTVNNLPAMQETSGSIPGLGRSPGVGNDNPLQYSCLEKSINRGG